MSQLDHDVIAGFLAQDKIANTLNDLSEAERSFFLEALAEQQVTGRSFNEDVLWEFDYSRQPPSPEQFLNDDYYMGKAGKDMFPYWRDAFLEVCALDSKITNVVATGPIGSGKSTFSNFCLAYKLCRVACLRNPIEFYRLMQGSSMYFGIYSISKDNVQQGCYGQFVDMMKLSPFFKEVAQVSEDKEYKNLLVDFPGNVRLRGGSTTNHAISLNLFGCILEEMNFRTEKDASQAAYDMLNSVERRIESRFMQKGGYIPGVVIINSSKKYQTDFLDRYITQNRGNPKVRVYDEPIWVIKGVFPGEERVSQNQIEYSGEFFKVDSGTAHRDPRIMEEGEEEPTDGAQVIDVPVEYQPAFNRDLDGSLRDYAGVSTGRANRLFSNIKILREAFVQDLPNPITSFACTVEQALDHTVQDYFDYDVFFIRKSSQPQPRLNPGSGRFAHIDLSKTGDGTGICVAHVSSYSNVEVIAEDGTVSRVMKPIITVDFMIRIKSQGSRIDYSKIRAFFVWLRNHGMEFKMITLDDYQSTDFQMIMQKMNFPCTYRSVDRKSPTKPYPYYILKNAISEGRLRIPADYSTEQQGVVTVYKELENLIDGEKKVDHPDEFMDGSPGSKDLSDALAGAIMNVTELMDNHEPDQPLSELHQDETTLRRLGLRPHKAVEDLEKFHYRDYEQTQPHRGTTGMVFDQRDQ